MTYSFQYYLRHKIVNNCSRAHCSPTVAVIMCIWHVQKVIVYFFYDRRDVRPLSSACCILILEGKDLFNYSQCVCAWGIFGIFINLEAGLEPV